MKVLIKPRAELEVLFSKEDFKNSCRQLIEPNVDLLFYNDIEEQAKENIIKEIDVLIGPKINETELELYSNLKMHQTFATGLEMFNFDFYKKNNIVLCNSHTHSKIIAEYGFALLLSLAKEINMNDQLLREGNWDYTQHPAITLFGKTVLFLGYGNIAQILKEMCIPFQMKFIAVKRTKQCKDLSIKTYTADEKITAIKQADIIINTLPLTKNTISFIDKAEFNAMKSSVIIINVGRGVTINEKELYSALKGKKIRGAALDVWYNYPNVRGGENQDPFPCYPSKFPFHKLKNVIMTAHRAWQSDALMTDLKPFFENVNRFLRGERPENVVNLDEGY
ncbi:MAG: NAD(P)-dependent oxidoreductase [Candidatus Hermodarchaeota archaeon]